MMTHESADPGVQKTAATAKPHSPFWVGLLFVGTTVFVCLLSIVHLMRPGRAVWIGVIILPVIVLPSCFILRFDRRPWQFSISSLLLLTTVYALLLGLATPSFVTFWRTLWFLESALIPPSYLLLVCYVMGQRGWHNWLLALPAVAGLVVTLTFLFVMISELFEPSWRTGPKEPPWITIAIASAGVMASTFLMFGGTLRRFAGHRRR
jgi:hypothetical protein